MRGRVNLKSISDDELLRRLSELLRQSRGVEADLIAHIAEVDERRLFAREAMPSMFAYCTEVLHLSEHEAFLRISVARASREHPVLLMMLRDGRLHLSGISKLAPHITQDNREGLLKQAAHKSKRQIEELVAELAPRPRAPAMIRRLPGRGSKRQLAAQCGPSPDPLGTSPLKLGPDRLGPAGHARDQNQDPAERLRPGLALPAATTTGELGPDRVAPARQSRAPVVEPVGPARFRVHFDASAELRDKLERLQALMRPSVPDGDLTRVIEAAVTEKLERLEAKRFGKTKAPRKRLGRPEMNPRSRHIPAAVRRFVEDRDKGRCTYRDRHGRRCTRRHDLEFHHRVPYGCGGAHSPENLTLMCRAHNALLAEHDYGKKKMARYRRPQPAAGGVSETKAVWLSGSRPVRFSGGLSPPAGA